jgi:major membrane immunogen (membrane-anchored lipoprotein)
MKKRIIACTVLTAMALTGCGSKGFTGEKVGEVAGGFGGTTKATVKFEDGKPVSVEIDNIDDNGGSKIEASKEGTYDMHNAPGKKWHEQIDLLEDAIVSNEFDLSKLNITDGKTDAVSGVTISVQEYVDAVQNALNQAK